MNYWSYLGLVVIHLRFQTMNGEISFDSAINPKAKIPKTSVTIDAEALEMQNLGPPIRQPSTSPGISEEKTREEKKKSKFEIRTALEAFSLAKKAHYAQAILLGATFLFLLIAAFCEAHIFRALNRCPLKAVVVLNSDTSTLKTPFRLDRSNTNWGPESDCNVTQYGFLAGAIASFILAWFFMLLRPKYSTYIHKGASPSPVGLLVPGALLVTLVFSIYSVVAVSLLSHGLSVWCSNFKSCSASTNFILIGPQGDSEGVRFYAFAITSQVFAWLGTVGWILNLILISLRTFMHLDFPSSPLPVKNSVESATAGNNIA